jgi:predicted outer membrane protein
MQIQVQAHQEATQLLKSYSQNGDNQQLKALATKVLAVVQQHADHAKNIETPRSAQR